MSRYLGLGNVDHATLLQTLLSVHYVSRYFLSRIFRSCEYTASTCRKPFILCGRSLRGNRSMRRHANSPSVNSTRPSVKVETNRGESAIGLLGYFETTDLVFIPPYRSMVPPYCSMVGYSVYCVFACLFACLYG